MLIGLEQHGERVGVQGTDQRLAGDLAGVAEQFRQLLDEMPKASERVMTLLHDRLLAND